MAITRRCAVLLLAVQAGLLSWSGWSTSPNRTEIGHMAATVYLWHAQRFDVFHVNPPLSHIVNVLPVSLCQPTCDWSMYSSRPRDRSEWALGSALIEANSPEKIRWCFALARWSLIPILLLGGYFGYRLSREMYGNAAGLLFLSLWCFSPLLTSWGATNCPDAVAAALGIVTLYAFRRWLSRPDWAQGTVAGVCLGLLPLTKLTWVVAFGLWPAMWFLWTVPSWLRKRNQPALPYPPLRQLMGILLVSLYVLNVGYLFDGTFRPLGTYEFISPLFNGQELREDQPWPSEPGNRLAGPWLGWVPVPLPADFVQGIDTQRYDFERGLPSYVRGQWADEGWWYFYLYALLVKVPLGTWCLLILAVGVTIFGRGYSTSWRDEVLVLGPGMTILVLVSSQTGFSVHSRYVIPALPFFFIWASKVTRVFSMRPFTHIRMAVGASVVMALTWSISSSLWIYPHSLSYFNELAGGPKNGGWHLLKSNIDAGQGLFYLRRWLDAHPRVTLDGLAFYGTYSTTLAGIPQTPRPPSGPVSDDSRGRPRRATADAGPRPGWYALSVSHLYDRNGQYRYFLDHFKPVAMAGYSIYIYHITTRQANRVRRELKLPELPLRETGGAPGGHRQSSVRELDPPFSQRSREGVRTILSRRRGLAECFGVGESPAAGAPSRQAIGSFMKARSTHRWQPSVCCACHAKMEGGGGVGLDGHRRM